MDYNENPTSAAGSSTSRTLLVPEQLAGLRLDQALARMLPAYSRTRLQEWVKAARVTVDGAVAAAKDKVWGGERVELRPEADDAARAATAQAIPLDIVYEDDRLLVVDKPAGLVVHPGSGNPDGTLLNALLHHVPALASVPRAGIVHRLDKDTSGLLVVAKTIETQTNLVRQLEARRMHREYVAIVVGAPPPHGVVEAPIGRHPRARTRMAVVSGGKVARTHYRVVRAAPTWAQLECRLDTGRTHQIRVHMHSIGHPLIGDPVYRSDSSARKLPPEARGFPRQALHAIRLAFLDVARGAELRFESPLPADLVQLMNHLEAHAPAR